ncbi:MAG: hypothetical protein J6T88_01720 [Bacteroidales bacterium]|nr:hypothetical protein [Bacteroidales bacterium]
MMKQEPVRMFFHFSFTPPMMCLYIRVSRAFTSALTCPYIRVPRKGTSAAVYR